MYQPEALLCDLIRIPSINPMGRPLKGPEIYETRVTEYLKDFFQKIKVDFELQDVDEGRQNVFAKIERPGSKRTILLEVHQDTVPVDGMTIDPFDPVIKDGRIYGRGACDVKGGLAAFLSAFASLTEKRPSEACNVVLACTVDEEYSARGVLALAQLWTDPLQGLDSLLTDPPDAAIVAEPTNLDVVVAHKGTIRWKIQTIGKACHSSQPEKGINAIYDMANLVQSLARYAEQLPQSIPEHPLCGPATLSVGRITGGISANTVPDECLIEIDRRVLPGEDAVQARENVESFLREQEGACDFIMLPPWSQSPALPDSGNHDVASRLGKAIDHVRGQHNKIGVTYGSDASKIARADVPTVVFGPGSIVQAHTADEWLSLDELNLATEIVYHCIAECNN